MTAVGIVEELFGRSRFQQRPKIDRFTHLLEEQLDFDHLYDVLGMKHS